MKLFTLLFVVVVVVALASTVCAVDWSSDKIIEYFKDTNQRGASAKLSLRNVGCANVNLTSFNDQVKSLRILGAGVLSRCVTAWEHVNCKGRRIQICGESPAANDVSTIGFGGIVSSFGWCRHGEL